MKHLDDSSSLGAAVNGADRMDVPYSGEGEGICYWLARDSLWAIYDMLGPGLGILHEHVVSAGCIQRKIRFMHLWMLVAVIRLHFK